MNKLSWGYHTPAQYSTFWVNNLFYSQNYYNMRDPKPEYEPKNLITILQYD